MDAVILAAGLGTRLRPHTLTTPKPLLPVQGRPILDWTFGALPDQVDRVIVVTHYLAEKVEAYLHEQEHFKEWVAVPQGDPQGTGDAFRKCRAHVRSDRVMVINGDDLFGAADLARLAECQAGVIVTEVQEPKKFGIAFLKPDGTLEKLLEKPDLPAPQLANTGAYIFPRAVFDIEITRSPRGEYEITDYVTKLAARIPFQVVRSTFWFPIGTEDAWNAAQTMDLSVVRAARQH
ncbi:MAG: nucleotidyltransferase family protein [Planctomycetes bacterium]|jgi:bifunctional UDP-N-acetylglucosamine pyrophosphorylase/glucosamine-1-phosphate N-acetyltransferase|nr:nucleotidyltransferase family protein [Planctomycetota bacterium]